MRNQFVIGYKPINGISSITTAKKRMTREFAPILNFAQLFDLLFAICQSANLEKYRTWVIVERISVRHNNIPPILEIAHEPSCSNPITRVMIEIDPPITTMVVLTMDEYQ